jgi:hypothetical protein
MVREAIRNHQSNNIEVFRNESLEIITYHDDLTNPREWCNIGKVAMFSRSIGFNECGYNDPEEFLFSLVDETIGDTYKAEDFMIETRKEAWAYFPKSHRNAQERWYDSIITKIEEKYIILPIYMYNHSGIALNTTGFSCPWDSGQAGWIYVAKKDACKEFGRQRMSVKLQEKVEAYLRGEVETLSSYINGECYGYKIISDTEEDHNTGYLGYYEDFVKEEVLPLFKEVNAK